MKMTKYYVERYYSTKLFQLTGLVIGSLDLEWSIQHNSISEMYNYRSAVGNEGKKATKKGGKHHKARNTL